MIYLYNNSHRMNKFLPIVLVCLLCGCAGGGGKKAPVASVPEFPMVDIPSVLAEPQDRVDYMTEHFWDRFTGLSGQTDSASVKGLPSAVVEEKFVFWVTLLKAASVPVMEKAVSQSVDVARADGDAVFGRFLDFADKHLYDPNSPGRNEEAYLALLNRALGGALPNEDMRQRYEYCVSQCSLNRIGQRAADFKFISREGRMMRLYDVEAPVMLLIFSNPGCPTCALYQENLQKNKPLQDAMRKGSFKVVNIYPDEDIQAWEDYVRTYPAEWVCGRDPLGQLHGGLYSLRAIPSLYLLDKDKKVILKDASYEEVEIKLYDLIF